MIFFGYPVLLWALFLALIPVIIHLINLRRYKKIYFSNTALLQNILIETRKLQNLKNILVLLMRIIAVIALVLAFAQPYFQKDIQKKRSKANIVSVYLDNSFSMENSMNDQILFSEAKRSALDIVDVYGDGVGYQLISNDPGFQSQQTFEKEAFEQAISELMISSRSKSIDQVLKSQQEFLLQSTLDGSRRYLISDFQKSVTDVKSFPADSIITHLVVLKGDKQNNIFIDSLWLESPIRQKGKQLVIKANLVNYGDRTLEKIPLKLMINDQQRALNSVSIEPFSSKVVMFRYVPLVEGKQRAEIQISDGPVVFDDRFYFVIDIIEEIKVLDIYSQAPNKYVKAIFKSDSVFSIDERNVNQLNYDDLNNYDLIVLDQIAALNSGLSSRLKTIVENGTTLIVIPSKRLDVSSYRQFQSSLKAPIYSSLDTSRARLNRINLNHPLVRNVYEEVESNYESVTILKQYALNSSNAERSDFLLKDLKERVILSETKYKKGRLYQFSVPFDESFSTLHYMGELVVPMMLNIGISSNNNSPAYYFIGEESLLSVPTEDEIFKDEVLKVKAVNSDIEYIPRQKSVGSQQKIFLDDQIQHAGHYHIKDDTRLMTTFAMNYSSRESLLEVMNTDTIQSLLNKYSINNHYHLMMGDKMETEMIIAKEEGRQLWYFLLIIALIALFCEQALLRWMK